MENLKRIALETRQKIFEVVCNNKAGHLASSLSSVEILTTLYFGGILNYDPQNPDWDDRDRFVLSKCSSTLGLYVTLAKAGYYDLSELDSFCIAGTKYGGLSRRGKVKGVEATTGSLGHGFSFAAGMAMNAKLFQKPYQVYVMLGDGELQEGSVWETAMFIAQHQLTNMVAIVDANGLQGSGKCEDIIQVNPIEEKWKAFGFETFSVDGHDMKDLQNVMSLQKRVTKPTAIIAQTVKGKGLSFVENMPNWHLRMPSTEQIEIGLKELEMDRRRIHTI